MLRGPLRPITNFGNLHSLELEMHLDRHGSQYWLLRVVWTIDVCPCL